jgi:hypothetical protein
MNTPANPYKTSWPHPALILGICSAFLAAWLWDASVASVPPAPDMILGSALVTDTQCRENTRVENGRSETYFLPALTYTYSANGRNFEGHSYTMDPVFLKMNRDQCERLNVELRASNTKTIWYSQSNPANAVLNPSTPQPPLAIEIFTVLASILVVLGIWLQLRWLHPQQPPQQSPSQSS